MIPAGDKPSAGRNSATGGGAQMAELWKLLPPNYNISKIPEEVCFLVSSFIFRFILDSCGRYER